MLRIEAHVLIEIEQNKGGYPLLVLPEDPKKWADGLKELYREEGHIGMFAANIPDGGKNVEIYFGAADVEHDETPPAKNFGFVIDREVFRKLVKSMRLVLEASDNE